MTYAARDRSSMELEVGHHGRGTAVCSLLEQVELPGPFWAAHALFRDRTPWSFLLDSAKAGPRWTGATSFAGGAPSSIVRAKRIRRRAGARGPCAAELEILEPSRGVIDTRIVSGPELFSTLRTMLAARRPPDPWRLRSPIPFLGGAVGYFGYELGSLLEDLPDDGEDDLGLPDLVLMFTDTVLAHEHDTGKTWLSITGRGLDPRAAKRDAERSREEMIERIERAVLDVPALEVSVEPSLTGGRTACPALVEGRFDRASYGALVERAKDHILAGDVFEVCLSHRLDVPYAGDPWALYSELRRRNPAPYAAYLDVPEAKIICSSPERFLHLGADRVAESRPIKGTRRRGASPEEDLMLLQELASSEKDRAENMMIVDLVRNDIGRVSKIHSVQVPELMAIERYATVFQMVSTIRGELEDGLDGLDLIAACFPGGSMTGAPKIEAMKIIDRLEPLDRGVYSGSIGYIDDSGRLDLNIVIRTIVLAAGRATIGVGGAVVADSDPAAEHAETMDKARALIEAIGRVEEDRRPKCGS